MTEGSVWREWDLRGLEVQMLCFDYRFRLLVGGAENHGMDLLFESPFCLRSPSGDERRFNPENAVGLAPLLTLLHGPVQSFSASSVGECRLTFADGQELRAEPHPHYDAWEARGSGNLASIALLCGPGGGSPWGPSQG